MWVNISFCSLDRSLKDVVGANSHRRRFYLDTPLNNVSTAQLINFEHFGGDSFVPQHQNKFYFSEVWDNCLPFFVCSLPPGKYTIQALCSVINNSLLCPKCVNKDYTRPQNTYNVSICPQTSRLILRSTGECPYALHNVTSTFAALVVSKTSDTVTFQLFSRIPAPFARGALIEVYSVDVRWSVVQVVDIDGSTKIICNLSVPDICLGKEISIRPLSSYNSIHSILGFDDCDTLSEQKFALSGAAFLTTSDIIISSLEPLGVVVGDTVRLHHKNGSLLYGRVTDLRDSHAHATISIDFTTMIKFPLTIQNTQTNTKVTIESPIMITMQAQHLILHIESTEVWLRETVTVLISSKNVMCEGILIGNEENIYQIAIDVCAFVSDMVYTEILSSETEFGVVCLSNYLVDITRNRRLAFVRLWMGKNEASNTLILRPSGVLNVFGRIQLRQQRHDFVSLSGNGDSSLIGDCCFVPPLSRVPYIEVEILNEHGECYKADNVGEWSLMIRCKVETT